jgi:hypothetical protein
MYRTSTLVNNHYIGIIGIDHWSQDSQNHLCILPNKRVLVLGQAVAEEAEAEEAVAEPVVVLPQPSKPYVTPSLILIYYYHSQSPR